MPIIAGSIVGGASLLGGISGASATSRSTKRSIQFQREMAQNKYQYLMKDLQSAGLNPILAAQSATAGPAGANAPVIPYMNPLGDAAQAGIGAASTAQGVIESEQNIEESISRVLVNKQKELLTKYQGWTEFDRRALVQTQKAVESTILAIRKKELEIKDFDVYWADFKRRSLDRIESMSKDVRQGAEGHSNVFSRMFNEFMSGSYEVVKAFWNYGEAMMRSYMAK